MTVRKGSNWRRLVALAAIGTTALAGCSSGAANVDSTQPQSGGTLTIALPKYPSAGLNPHNRGNSWDDTQVLRNAYDTLLVADFDETFHEGLAESWTVSDDGKIYEFKLRKNVTFHDGEAFNAQAVKTNFDLIVNPDYPAQDIAVSNLSGLSEVVVVDDLTVRFVLEFPRSDLLYTLSNVGASIVSPKSLENRANWESGEGFVGTGPFILTKTVPDEELDFVRNDDYDWAPGTADHDGPAYVENLIVKYVEEGSVRAGLLTSGQVQAVGTIEATDVDQFKDSTDFLYEERQANVGPWTLFFNTTNGPTEDIRVRKALQSGADLTKIVSSVTLGVQERAWYIVPNSSKFYDASFEKSYGDDPAAANALLDEAGWTGRDDEGYRVNADGERLTIRVIAAKLGFIYPQEDVLKAYQAEIRENLGVEIVLDYLDDATVKQRLADNDYEALPRMGGGSDPGAIINKVYGGTNTDGTGITYRGISLGSIINGSKLNDQEVNDAIVDSLLSTSDEERTDAFRRAAQRAIVDLAASLPLYAERNSAAASATLGTLDGFLDAPRGTAVGWAYNIWIKQ